MAKIRTTKRETVKKWEREGGDSDIIDCVDIYQQPAFNHLLLKNHTIQMKPSSIPGGENMNSFQEKLFQGWHKCGQCPEATIPIRRSREDEHPRAMHFKPNDQKTRFFIYWASDGYHETSCYNLECSGFVQTNHKFAIGSPIEAVSSYDSVSAIKFMADPDTDENNENWWLQVDDQLIGYWPQSIFTYLASSATTLDWGGEIYNSKPGGSHTKTQMGSGHFPDEGYGKASYFRNIQYMDSTGNFRDAEDMGLILYNYFGNGTHVYFGGPGYSEDKCP
ncbi:hypothetical protein ACB098_05G034800 [Castanea mollissima]